jgi:hypothetical protein
MPLDPGKGKPLQSIRSVIARNEVTKQSIFVAAIRVVPTSTAVQQLPWCGAEDRLLRWARNDENIACAGAG